MHMMLAPTAFGLVVLLAVVVVVQADIYMHNPRGSNNRNCRTSANAKERQNDNRLFDSENNDNGGYSCPRAYPFDCYKLIGETGFDDCAAQNANLEDATAKAQVNSNGDLLTPGAINTPTFYYYGGSVLPIEWTVQHGLGPNDELHAGIVIQYACEDTLRDNCGEKDPTPNNVCNSPFFPDGSLAQVCTMRDGTPVSNTGSELNRQATDTIPDADASQDDYRYGRHETLNYYRECRRRERNKGLWTADQNLNKNDARSTREQPNGERFGLECNEEASYWPYWHHSPWKDVAVVVGNEDSCGYFTGESQNTKPRNRCACAPGQCLGDAQQPNNERECIDEGHTWCQDASHNIAPPACVVAEFNRQNHLGNVGGGTNSNQFNWTLPAVGTEQKCTLRVRYNISTWDATSSGLQASALGTSSQNDNASPVFDNDNNEAKTFKTIDGLGAAELGFAINTNQYGRTFQDRSYAFNIRPAPSDGPCEGKLIHNLNVRGKRGNIVQTYPAVEYDFVPSKLTVTTSECVHLQWTGSDYNPNRNGNNGEGGPYAADNQNRETKSDRNNLVQMAVAGANFPVTSSADFNMFKTDQATFVRAAWVDQDPSNCLGISEMLQRTGEQMFANRARREENHFACSRLSGAATPYMDVGLMEPGDVGEYYFMSTRNNNFSNRGQKGKLTVIRGGLSVGAIIGIVLASMASIAAGVVLYRRRKAKLEAAGGPQVGVVNKRGPGLPYGAAGGGGAGGHGRPPSTSTGGITAVASGVAGFFSGWGARAAPSSGGGAGMATATYPHVAQEPGELSFNKGDSVRIISRDPSGWWEGEVNGQVGVFPGSYVRA